MIYIPKENNELRYEPYPRPEEVEGWLRVAYRCGLDDGLRAAEVRRLDAEERRNR